MTAFNGGFYPHAGKAGGQIGGKQDKDKHKYGNKRRNQ